MPAGSNQDIPAILPAALKEQKTFECASKTASPYSVRKTLKAIHYRLRRHSHRR